MALSFGFNFIPVPKPLKDLQSYILQQYEDYARRIRIKHLFNHSPDNSDYIDPLRPTFTDSTWQAPPGGKHIESYLKQVRENLISEVNNFDPSKKTSRQYSPPWLTNTLKELSDNRDIIVTEADKNMGVAVVKTSDYVHLGFKHLMDGNSYELCDGLPNYEDLWKCLEEILSKHNRLQYFDTWKKTWTKTKLAKFLLQLKGREELKLGTFYMLMKVHKTPLAGRPIVSSINTITYFASKYIDRRLQPIYKRIPSFLKSSRDLILELERTYFTSNKDFYILCADVDSLYPSIPIEKGLQMMKDSLVKRNNELPKEGQLPADEISFLLDLMKFVLDNNYFSFGNLIFRQKQGTAMGTPAAVVFACLFLDTHETNILNLSVEKPILYKRYIDDIFAIFRKREDAELFLTNFSATQDLPTIKCSSFTINDKEGTFLDLTIYKGERFESTGRLDIRVFQKPQNKYLYLPRNSFHPKATFPAYIISEINRYRLICSNDEDFEVVKKDFHSRLIARGYTEDFLNPLFLKGKSRNELLQNLQKRETPQEPKKTKIIFKTLHLPQTRGMRIKSCLKLTDEVLETREGIEVFSRQEPIICYSNTRPISSYFSQKRNKIHSLTLQPIVDNNRVDVDNMIEIAIQTDRTHTVQSFPLNSSFGISSFRNFGISDFRK